MQRGKFTVNRSHSPIRARRLFIHASGGYIYLVKSFLFHAYTAVSLVIVLILFYFIFLPSPLCWELQRDEYYLWVVGSMPCIVVSTAAAARELFQTNDAIFCGRPTKLIWTIFGGGSTEYKSVGSAAPDGPYWPQLRKLCRTELFSPKRHASYETIRTEEIHYMMKLLLEMSCHEGTIINLKVWLFGVTANNMTRMLVNKRFVHSIPPKFDKSVKNPPSVL